MSISPKGDFYLSYFREGKGSTILAEDGREIGLKPPDRNAFWSPHVQRFADDRWLVVESRTRDLEPNAFIFGPDGSFSHKFHAGDGIETVLTDQANHIWIGYFDEGVSGSSVSSSGAPAPRFGPNGLVRVDDRGEMEFGFNDITRGRDISDIYALTIDDEGRIWLCPYGDFFVASVDNETIDFPLDHAPVAGAQAMSVGPEHFVFFGGYGRECIVTVVERATQRLRLIQLHDQDLGPLSLQLVATRGKMAIAMADDRLYRLDLDMLLDPLGPWLDRNSSSVASAVRYMEEEASYAESMVIKMPTGETRNYPGKPRPPENQPRNDDCGKP